MFFDVIMTAGGDPRELAGRIIADFDIIPCGERRAGRQLFDLIVHMVRLNPDAGPIEHIAALELELDVVLDDFALLGAAVAHLAECLDGCIGDAAVRCPHQS